MSFSREPCGCAHDGRTWLKWCAACWADFSQRHERAAKEKADADLLGCYYLIPERPDQPKTK